LGGQVKFERVKTGKIKNSLAQSAHRLNSKFQITNYKQIQNSNVQNSKGIPLPLPKGEGED